MVRRIKKKGDGGWVVDVYVADEKIPVSCATAIYRVFKRARVTFFFPTAGGEDNEELEANIVVFNIPQVR